MTSATPLLPAPGTIRLLPGWLGQWLCLGFGALAVVVVGIVHGHQLLIALHGTPSEGIVLAVEDRRTMRGVHIHSITVQHRSSAGAEVVAQTRIPEAERIRMTVMESMRSPVALWTVPYAPWAVGLRTEAAPPWPDAEALLLLAAGLAALGLGVPFLWWRHARARASLERAGGLDASCRTATIIMHVAHWPGGSTWGRAMWRDETGAEGFSLARVRDSLPAPGSSVLVRVDPVSGQAWWEGEFTRP